MAQYLTTATIGQFELRSYVRDKITFRRRHRSGSSTAPTAAPPDGRTVRLLAAGRLLVPAAHPHRAGAKQAAPGCTSGWQGTPSRTTTSRSSRPAPGEAPSGQRCPTSTGTPARRTRILLPGMVGDSPVLGALPERGGGRLLHAHRQYGSVVGCQRRQIEGYERWSVDLSRFAGRQAEVSISYASDDIYQFSGLFVDDIVNRTSAGTTSFEDDGNTFRRMAGGRATRGAARATLADWMIGTTAQAPSTGKLVQAALDRQPDFLKFLSRTFGPYPFSTAGGVVDDVDTYAALENQYPARCTAGATSTTGPTLSSWSCTNSPTRLVSGTTCT